MREEDHQCEVVVVARSWLDCITESVKLDGQVPMEVTDDFG